MRQRTGTFFTCKVKYEKMMEDGLVKSVTEQYVVEAMSFAEAEERITKEMQTYISGEFGVEDISKGQFREVFFSDTDDDDKWYKAKLAFITIDERTEKEKRTNIVYLVQAGSLNGAIKNVDDVMGTTMIYYDSLAVQETPIMDLFEHKA